MAATVVILAVLAAYLALAGGDSGPAALAGLAGILALGLYGLAIWRCATPLPRARATKPATAQRE